MAGVRALHAAGWSVAVASSDPLSLAASSRFCARSFETPAVEEDLEGFITAVDSAARSAGCEVVLCGGGDAEMLALSREAERIDARIPLTPYPQMLKAIDKLELSRAAAAAGLAVPPTTAAEDFDPSSISGPVIVKARIHAPGLGYDGPARLEAGRAEDPERATELIASINSAGGRAVVQQPIEGTLMAFASVRSHSGELVAQLQQISPHTWPPGDGISSRSVTVPVDRELAAAVAELLEGLGWIGLSQIQFIVDGSGSPHLIDLNGRFYGSLALAEAAGVNLAAAWAEVGSDRPQAPRARAVSGVRYQWAEGDLRRALKERRGGVARDLVETVGRSPSARSGIWRRGDQRPVLRSWRRLASRVVRRLR